MDELLKLKYFYASLKVDTESNEMVHNLSFFNLSFSTNRSHQEASIKESWPVFWQLHFFENMLQIVATVISESVHLAKV